MKNKVTFIGSVAMGDAFWYDCNYNQDGGGLHLIEKKLQKRVNKDSDIDILILDPTVTNEEIEEYIDENLINWRGCKIERHYIDPLVNYIKTNIPETAQLDIGSAIKHQKNILFTLKASHVAWDDVYKSKTFYDLYLMSWCGCKIIPELYYELIEFWKNKFGEKWRADFNQESVDFFDDFVSRADLHDDLHWSMKQFEKPAYMYLQEEGQTTVYVDEEKFWKVGEDIRKAVVIEEAQALAMERYIVPKMEGKKVKLITPHGAYIEFVEGLVDRLAPLWMTIYIVENFYYFIDYKEDFVKKYKK